MATIALQQQQQQQPPPPPPPSDSPCQWSHTQIHHHTIVSLAPTLPVDINPPPTLLPICTTPTNSHTSLANPSTNRPLKRPWNDKDSRDILQLMLTQFDNHPTPPPSDQACNHASQAINKTLDLFGCHEMINTSSYVVGANAIEPTPMPVASCPPHSSSSSNLMSDRAPKPSNSISEITVGIDPLGTHHVPFLKCWENSLNLKTGEVYHMDSNSKAPIPIDPCDSSASQSKDISQYFQPILGSSSQQHEDPYNDVNLTLASGSTSCSYPLRKNKMMYSTGDANLELNLNLSSFQTLGNTTSQFTINQSTRVVTKETLTFDMLDDVGNNLHDNGNKNMVIVGCPCCLMYVMLWTSEPKCPKCGSYVIDTNCQSNKRTRGNH